MTMHAYGRLMKKKWKDEMQHINAIKYGAAIEF